MAAVRCCALAAFPIDLPEAESKTPFQPVDVADIAATIAWLAAHDPADKTVDAVVWDLMAPQPVTLGGVIEQFRAHFGTANFPRIVLPVFLLDLGAKLGDLVSGLGWTPMRTTAITELRRGVAGDPHQWMAATGIVPKALSQMVGQRSATIQMVCPPVSDQGAGDRKPRCILDSVGLHRASNFL